MNINERKQAILAQLELRRFGHVDHSKDEKTERFSQFEFDWNSLSKPPLQAWLPVQAFTQLQQLISDVRIMNNPVLKFKYMNEILFPYRFRPYHSGTNRRTFYHIDDPTILIKIGSDRVGKSDNISEFYLQNLIKPHCAKIYDVTADGIVQLHERAEPMSEHDYKHIYSGQIFDFIMSLMYKGYMLEDVGGNFFKNWAVRLGFGPILIDFPYIYEVDWSKLKCIFVDPKTHIKCTGDLDYDYDKGMSEIICTKCGARYSAKYLAKAVPTSGEDFISRKGKNNMQEFKLSVVSGNDVLYTTSSEAPANPVLQSPIVRPSDNYIESPRVYTITRQKQVKKPQPKQPEKHVIKTVNTAKSSKAVVVEEKPKQVTEFVVSQQPTTQVVEQNPQDTGRISIVQTTETQRVATKYTGPTSYAQKEEFEPKVRVEETTHKGPGQRVKGVPNRNTGRPGNLTPITPGNTKEPRSSFRDRPIREEVKKELDEFLDNIDRKYGRGATIDLARRCGLFYTGIEKRREGEPATVQNLSRSEKAAAEAAKKKEEEAKHHQVEVVTTQAEAPAVAEVVAAPKVEEEVVTPVVAEEQSAPETPAVVVEEEEKSNNIMDQIADRGQGDIVSSPVESNQEIPKEGLFVVKPKTAEEIEAEDLANRQDTVAMGIVGEPLVDTMKLKNAIPTWKNLILESINGFNERKHQYPMSSIEQGIRELIGDDVAKVTGTSKDGLEITVNATTDSQNYQCYAVKVENFESPLFDLVLYNKTVLKEMQRDEEARAEEAAKEIDLPKDREITAEEAKEFFKSVIGNYKAKADTKEEYADKKSYIVRELITDIMDKGPISLPVISKVAEDLVDEIYNQGDKEETTLAVDEL